MFLLHVLDGNNIHVITSGCGSHYVLALNTHLEDTTNSVVLHRQTDPNYNSNKHLGDPTFMEVNLSDDKDI